MHEPSDSSLLWDAVRVMCALLKQADALVGGAGSPWHDHCRAAKKRARKIQFTRGRPNRVQLYRELIVNTHATLAYLKQANERLAVASTPSIALWQIAGSLSAISRTHRPTERAAGVAREPVPASEKLVSLFEPHADIIVKGSGDTEYGYKLNLTTGRSGMILDLVIEASNPADSDRLPQMLERHIGIWGQAPRQAAADGGFATRDNLVERSVIRFISGSVGEFIRPSVDDRIAVDVLDTGHDAFEAALLKEADRSR